MAVILTREALDTLLASLDSDRERAGQKYEDVRRRLQKFFTWRGSRRPDELADETIDRVCRRLREGEVIRAAEPAAYFYGVARNVLREEWDRERMWKTVEETLSGPVRTPPPPSDAAVEDRRLECLQRCLGALPPESRQLVLRYYQEEKGAKIGNRKALAAALGVAMNILRIRMHRIRVRLEACARDCLAKTGETDWPGEPPLTGEDQRE